VGGELRRLFNPPKAEIIELRDRRIKRDLRLLLRRYRQDGVIVPFSVLSLRLRARHAHLGVTEPELRPVVVAEAERLGVRVSFD
jgi:hypothetical protein